MRVADKIAFLMRIFHTYEIQCTIGQRVPIYFLAKWTVVIVKDNGLSVQKLQRRPPYDQLNKSPPGLVEHLPLNAGSLVPEDFIFLSFFLFFFFFAMHLHVRPCGMQSSNSTIRRQLLLIWRPTA